jgi:hypothetical protein
VKSSYYTAPRSLNEATFIPGCDPIERHYAAPRWPFVVAWAVAMVFLTAILIGVAHGLR